MKIAIGNGSVPGQKAISGKSASAAVAATATATATGAVTGATAGRASLYRDDDSDCAATVATGSAGEIDIEAYTDLDNDVDNDSLSSSKPLASGSASALGRFAASGRFESGLQLGLEEPLDAEVDANDAAYSMNDLEQVQ